MPDPFATLGELARTAEDALGACRSRAASLRTRHEALVSDGFGDAKGSGITDDPMRDVFDAFDAPARLTLVERFAEALEASHASSEPASTRADSRSSFVRLEARLRASAKRCEAHLARGARGAALVSHLDGLRALWTAEGALAYKSTTEDFLERVERNRAALLRAWRAALAEALRASDRRDGNDGAPGETLGDASGETSEISAAAALAAGACHWLEARVERSSTPPVPSGGLGSGLRGTFEEHCARALEETNGEANRTDADVEKASGSALLARRLKKVAAAEETCVHFAASLPFSEPLYSVYAEAAKRAVGRALDETLDRRLVARNAAEATPLTVSDETVSDAEAAAAEVKALLAAFGGARVACAAYSKRVSLARRDDDETPSSSDAFEAAFASRRERLATTLTRHARVFAASSTSSADDGTSSSAAFESACAPALRALDTFASMLEDPARMPAETSAPERACAARALAAAGDGLAARAAALLSADGPETETETETESAALLRACAASRVASAAARALRRLESVEDEARAEMAEPAAAKETPRVSGRRRRSSLLERVALAARALASRVAAAAASSSLLEGAAAQPWGFHRKPEAMSGAQPCSPHIVVWRACALRGMRRLEAAAEAFAEGDENAAFSDAGETLAAYVDAVAAETAGAYARVVPSRAWRDRYIWDTRTIAETLYAMDQRRIERYYIGERDAELDARAAERTRVAQRAARALARRAALLTCPASATLESLESLFSIARSGPTETAHGADERDALRPEERLGGASRGDAHAWGRGVPFERLWLDEVEALFSDWRWMPPRAQAAEGTSFEGEKGTTDTPAEPASSEELPRDPWPCAKTEKALLAKADEAWSLAESGLASSASAAARLAALWHRSELSARDITPLDPEEDAMKRSLLAEVERWRGGSNTAVVS